jgi:hypothetical protein
MEPERTSPADRVYRAYLQDGSIDLFAGLAVAGTGAAWLFGLVALGPIAPAVAVPLWMAFRRQWVEPRLGRVVFDASRRGRLRRAHLLLIAAGCAALVLAVATYLASAGGRPDWSRTLAPALPAALVGLAAVLSALVFAIPRLAAYAVPFVLGGALVAALDAEPGWALLAGGVVVAAAGGARLARFFRQFPLLSNELS